MRAAAIGGPVQDIGALRSALMVRDHLGFRRASEALGVNVSILSRRIVALEDALGVSLFQRTPRGARTTRAGERFLVEVEAALQLLSDAAVRAGAAGRGETGRLRLGHVWPITAGPGEALLRAYRRSAKDVELELRVGPVAQLIAAVLERELDAAFLDIEDAPPTLDRHPLWCEPWLVARPPDAPEAPLGQPQLLCAATDNELRLRRLAAAAAGARPRLRVHLTSHDAILGLVGAGVGQAIVPQSVARATRAEVALSPLPQVPPLQLAAIWRNDHDNPMLRRFISLLRTAPWTDAPVAGIAHAAGARR